MSDRVWIELERTAGEEEVIAEKATKMLHKLGFSESVKFWWSEKNYRYCLTVDPSGHFIQLDDDGHWFNLDFIAETQV